MIVLTFLVCFLPVVTYFAYDAFSGTAFLFAKIVLLQGALQCDTGGVFIDKVWDMGGTSSSVDNTLHGTVRTAEKSGMLFQIEKAFESIDGALICHLLSLKDALTYVEISKPSGILTIEK